jgi:hypothetical protein
MEMCNRNLFHSPFTTQHVTSSFSGMSLKGFIGRKLLGMVPSTVPRWIINERIRGFGEVIDLKFDPEKKLLQGSVLLAGEKEPVLVTVDDYLLRRTADGVVVVVNSIAVDRPWIEILLRKLLVGKELRIPMDKGGFILDLLGI